MGKFAAKAGRMVRNVWRGASLIVAGIALILVLDVVLLDSGKDAEPGKRERDTIIGE